MLMKIWSDKSEFPLPHFGTLLKCEVAGALSSFTLSQRFRNPFPVPTKCVYGLRTGRDVTALHSTVVSDTGEVKEFSIEKSNDVKEIYSDAGLIERTQVIEAVKRELGTIEELVLVLHLLPHAEVEIKVSCAEPVQCRGKKWLATVPQWLLENLQKKPISAEEFQSLPVESRKDSYALSLTIKQLSPIQDLIITPYQYQSTFDQSRLNASITLLEWSHSHAIEIEFSTVNSCIPQFHTHYDQELNEYVGMISFIPPLLSDHETVEDIEGKGEFIFLIDRTKQTHTNDMCVNKIAPMLIMKLLSIGNTFNVVIFGTKSYSRLFSTSQPVSTESVSHAISEIVSMDVETGNGDLLSPLAFIASEDCCIPFQRKLFIFAQEKSYSEDVTDIVKKSFQRVQVNAFCFTPYKRALIHELSFSIIKQTFICESDSFELLKKVVSVLKKSLLPALSAIELEWPDSQYEQYPSNRYLPVCYYGEATHAYVNLGSTPSSTLKAKLKGIRTCTGLPIEWEVPIDTNCSAGDSLHMLWAKNAVEELSIEYKATHSTETLTKLKQISKRYGVPMKHAADDQDINPDLWHQHRYTAASPHYSPVYSPKSPVSRPDHCPKFPVHSPPSDYSAQSPNCSPPYPCYFSPPPVYYPFTPMPLTPVNYPSLCPHSPYCGSMPPSPYQPSGSPVCYQYTPPQSPPPFRLSNPVEYVDVLATYYSQFPPSTEPIKKRKLDPEDLTSLPLFDYSVLKIVILQEVDGLWLEEKVGRVYYAVQHHWTKDEWTTLCVLVLLEVKFGDSKEIWELVARKAKRTLLAAGMDVHEYAPKLQEELENLGII